MNFKPRALRFRNKPDGSKWIAFVFDDGHEWLPAIDDLAFAFALIGRCEDWKYPNGPRGYKMPRDFVYEAMDVLHGMSDEQIKSEGMKAIENLYRQKYDPNGLYRKGNSQKNSLDEMANIGWEASI